MSAVWNAELTGHLQQGTPKPQVPLATKGGRQIPKQIPPSRMHRMIGRCRWVNPEQRKRGLTFILIAR